MAVVLNAQVCQVACGCLGVRFGMNQRDGCCGFAFPLDAAIALTLQCPVFTPPPVQAMCRLI